MIPAPLDAERIGRLLETARGDRAPDAWLRNGRVVSVHTEEILEADISVTDGRIAYVGAAPPTVDEHTEVFDAQGAYVLPTYIEPHSHPWMLFNPDTLARFALPAGTTAHVAELLNLQLLLNADEVRAVWRALQRTPVRWYWSVRTAGQAAESVTEQLPRAEVEALLDEPGVVQIAEITGWPQLLAGDTALLDRVALANSRGLRVDGHGAGASDRRVPALAAAGFTADHESIDVDDVLSRLRAGLHAMLRNSSLRPDLDRFVDLCKDARFASQLSLTTDGAGPDWWVRHGGIESMVRTLVTAGVPLPRAVRFASLNPATYLRLDEHLGSLTPGRCADLQVLPDFTGSPPDLVLVDGQIQARAGELTDGWPEVDWPRHPAALGIDPTTAVDPASYLPRSAPGDTVPVMHLVSAGIARRDDALVGTDGWVPDAVHAVLFSPDGRHRSSGWLRGFAQTLHGLATTYTTSMGLLVLGCSPQAMARAASAAYAENTRSGGIAVVEGDQVTAQVDLDIAYTMSTRCLTRVAEQWRQVDAAVRRAGYPFDELLYCLCFITCDFLPDLRLVPSGLLDVKPYRLLAPAERLFA